MAYLLFGVAAFFTWGTLLMISQVGKVRPVVTPAAAAIGTLLNAFIVTVVVIAAFRML